MPHVLVPVREVDHPHFRKLAALLEPAAIEYARWGTFTYAVGANETKYMLLGTENYFDPDTSSRYDIRKPYPPLPLRNCTIKGTASTSGAIFLDPALPSYSNARETYYDRLAWIATAKTKNAESAQVLLISPYGAIVTSSMSFDTGTPAFVRVGPGTNLPLDYQAPGANARFQHTMRLPITNKFVWGMPSGAQRVTYVNLPSDWSAVPDPLAPYTFRDDFMGASLDTTTKWTRAQSTVGNVEISSLYPWLKLVGNGSWGANGAFGQTGYARSGQPTFLCDVQIVTANIFVGWHDGAGHSFSDFAHGVDFSGGSLVVFENGTSRGGVGSGYVSGQIYRVRIRALSGGGATYEIQGGTVYPAIGGPTWQNITPGTTTSATNTLHPGVTINDSGTGTYIGDVRVY